MSDSSDERSSLPVLIPLGQFAKSPVIKLSRPVYVVGSKDRCRIRLQSSTVSGAHALLVQTRHITYIRDLCSRSGLYINGKPVKEAVLREGDVLALGKFSFKYQGPKKEHADEPASAPAALHAAGAELPVPIEQRTAVIGRRPTCDIPLLELSASIAHAVIFAWEGKRFIRDLWARSGTFVNGKKIHEQELAPGDVIHCGDTDITFVPSLEEAAFSVIEGASDSIAADAPTVEEIDLGLSIAPRVSAEKAPLEVILPPQTPPKQQELLELEPIDELTELSSHETAHVPLSIHIEPAQSQDTASGQIVVDSAALAEPGETTSSEPAPEPVTPDADLNLPRRGWRSAIQESESVQPTPASPVAKSDPEVAPVDVEPAAPVEPVLEMPTVAEEVAPQPEPADVAQPRPSTEIIEPTQPTLESALDLPVVESTIWEPVDSPASLTDTTFGRTVEEFEGESLGPIIETPIEINDHSEPTFSEVITPLPAPEPEPILAPPPLDFSATVDASPVDASPVDASLLDASPILPEATPPALDELPADIHPEPIVDFDLDAINAIEPDEDPQVLEPALLPDDAAESPAIDFGPSIDAPALAEETIDAPAVIEPPLEPALEEPRPIEEPSPIAADQTLAIDPLPAGDAEQPVEVIESPLAIEPEVPEIRFDNADAVEMPEIRTGVTEPSDEHPLPPESLASIHNVIAAQNGTAERPVLLDYDVFIASEAPQSSQDDTTMAELAADADAAAQPIESAAVESDPPHLTVEPLSDSQVVATVDDSASLAPAELTTTDVEEPLPAVEQLLQPIDDETPAPEPPGPEAPTFDASQEPEAEAPLIDDEPIGQAIAPLISVEQDNTDLSSTAAVEDIEALPVDGLPEAAEPQHVSGDLGTLHATIDQSAAIEESHEPQAPVIEPILPASIEQTLDLGRLHPAEEHTAGIQVAGEDEPAVDHAAAFETPLVQMAPAETAIDLSKLSPMEDSVATEPMATESVTPTLPADDEPFTATAEVASQAPVDVMGPAVSEDPVDLSFLDNARPVDENTAAEMFEPHPGEVETTTLAGATPDDGLAVMDQSAIEPVPGDAVSDTIESTSTDQSGSAASLASSAVTEFPDLHPSTLDDSVVEEPPITLKTEPVPPPPGADSPIKIQPAPAIRPRRERKPRVIRNAFGQDPNAPRPGVVVIPPFSNTAASLGSGATLTSLSQAPAREADVFSDVPRPTAENPDSPADAFALPTAPEGDVFASELAKTIRSSSLTGLVDEAPPAAAPGFPRRARPRGVQPGVPIEGPRPAVAFANEESMAEAAERRRKLGRRAPILMGAMVVLIGAAWAAVWYLVPVRNKIEASLTFRNFASQIQRDQRLFQADQGNRLTQESTRNTAVHKLHELHPDMPPGFLQDPVKYATVESFWPDMPVGQMVLRYESTAAQLDKARLQAVALAMYDSNSQLADQTRTVKTQLENLKNLAKTNADKIADLNSQIEKARALVDQTPSKTQLEKLASDEKELEARYKDALGKYTDAQAELERLKKQQTEEAAAANADPATVDDEIQKMTKDADALGTQLATARKSRADMATQARATLDSAYDEFKKQLDTAQGAAKDNPQLAAYVNSAQNLQQAIRELTDQYIQHQQQDYTDLNALKSNFEAKMTDRKATLLATDPKLKDLSEQKEILTRKHNEAINSGLDKDASDLANELKLIDTAIKAQQEIVSNDPVYNELITGLQQLIDQKQRSINDERKKTDEKLASLRQSFNKSASAVSQMPADQQEVATAMRDRLAAIDAARKQYAEAADASAADEDVDIKRMNDELHTLQTNIEARKKQLAATNSPELRKAAEDQRAAALAQKTQEVANLNALMADALTAYKANQANLLKSTAIAEQAKTADAQLQQAEAQKQLTVTQKDQNDRELALRQEEARRGVEPVEPTADDVHIVGDPIDNRAQFGLGASAAIFVIFAAWIILTLRGAARESHYTYTPPIEPLETPGSPKVDADAEENEPAVA